MYDINKIRKQLEGTSKQLELLNLVHKQIVSNHYSKEMVITIPKRGYSSKLKKKIISMLGYKVTKKVLDDDIKIIKISE